MRSMKQNHHKLGSFVELTSLTDINAAGADNYDHHSSSGNFCCTCCSVSRWSSNPIGMHAWCGAAAADVVMQLTIQLAHSPNLPESPNVTAVAQTTKYSCNRQLTSLTDINAAGLTKMIDSMSGNFCCTCCSMTGWSKGPDVLHSNQCCTSSSK